MRGFIVSASSFIFACGSALGQASEVQPSFEAASIRPIGLAGSGRFGIKIGPGGITARSTTLKEAIEEAYGVRDYQLSGGPNWLDSDAYAIEATAGRAASSGELRLMFQSLLASRFKLVFHRETKELSVYALVIGKNGPKVHELKDGDPFPEFRPPSKGSRLMYSNSDLPGFAAMLSQTAGRPVLDKTGLTGHYVIRLESEPGEDILTAVQEELGLKLEPAKAPAEILVIDHAEKPSEN
jgi:uncharacterized protein (TIGR03435 family)